MSWHGEQIVATDRKIAALRQGDRKDWNKALRCLGRTNISMVSGPLGFVTEMYWRFGILRAAAEHLKNQNHGLVQEWVVWAQMQRENIQLQLDCNEAYHPQGPLEEAGTFFIEYYLRWGLRFLDEELPGWGYY